MDPFKPIDPLPIETFPTDRHFRVDDHQKVQIDSTIEKKLREFLGFMRVIEKPRYVSAQEALKLTVNNPHDGQAQNKKINKIVKIIIKSEKGETSSIINAMEDLFQTSEGNKIQKQILKGSATTLSSVFKIIPSERHNEIITQYTKTSAGKSCLFSLFQNPKNQILIAKELSKTPEGSELLESIILTMRSDKRIDLLHHLLQSAQKDMNMDVIFQSQPLNDFFEQFASEQDLLPSFEFLKLRSQYLNKADGSQEPELIEALQKAGEESLQLILDKIDSLQKV